ncbi:LOW QUALITY PROTEIN: probable xyloglucan galactosyltransferase GT15 [Capsella rubella]|uniref:LOW QUALITY PROTEIN: probable xyloglucan galactosyltransferase GT15 n=1 Tax=Capsella rubella TaxID=81985 RepID=UPI000CD5C154|nr:LOW QUALITY PROTEIN: probable xyloglucan galactosyltransferase GT15 [Capsella rubella]
MKNSNNNNSSSDSIQNHHHHHHPWKPKPTTLLLFLSLLTISLVLLHLSQNKIILITSATTTSISIPSGDDTCLGRYVYIHKLPSRFNLEILQDCDSITRPKDKISMCEFFKNSGFGTLIGSDYTPSWYATNQFMLEVIFHEKMKRYECLTSNSSLASAVYVPYYAGLDFRRKLRRRNVAARDAAGKELVNWLKKQPQWKGMLGKDHFLVTGRISRDFRRNSDKNSDWGTNLMLLPDSQNLTFLTIERSLTSHNEFAIPYPTYFHPTSTSEIIRWQDKIKVTNRTVLFSFAGAQRPSRNQNGLVRTEVIKQCKSSSKTCRFLDCDVKANSCNDPITLMKLFEGSVFCLQPPGDSLTRRSVFDSILAGCIPVYFNQGSAYKQYVWHIPMNNSEYSVYIPVKELRNGGKNKIEEILRGIPNERLVGLRENVIRLIPKIVYSEPNRNKPGGEVFEDAFDIALKGVLERIERIRRRNFKTDDDEEQIL